ncbi:MAG: hypothetical protein WAK82_17720 [Streptosporangiaceae bacterium]
MAKKDIDAAFAVNVEVSFVLVAELAPALAFWPAGVGATKASLVLLATPHSGLLKKALFGSGTPN